MASLCDGAACLGLPTSLDGNGCLTQPAECKDGVLVVRSQGVRQRRYSAFALADFAGGGPNVPMPPNVQTVINGPNTPGGLPLLNVDVTNPFCSEANITFAVEFAGGFFVSESDSYNFEGDVSISGGATFVDTPPPFTVSTFPTTYQIGLDASSTIAPDDNIVRSRIIHHSYTVLGIAAAGATFNFQALAVWTTTPKGGFRAAVSFNTAVSIIMSPVL